MCLRCRKCGSGLPSADFCLLHCVGWTCLSSTRIEREGQSVLISQSAKLFLRDSWMREQILKYWFQKRSNASGWAVAQSWCGSFPSHSSCWLPVPGDDPFWRNNYCLVHSGPSHGKGHPQEELSGRRHQSNLDPLSTPSRRLRSGRRGRRGWNYERLLCCSGEPRLKGKIEAYRSHSGWTFRSVHFSQKSCKHRR